MPGQYQFSLDRLGEAVATVAELGIPAILLFGIPEHKDARGSSALRDDGIVQEAIRIAKKVAPGLLVITDLCFCEYTDHGHCGPLTESRGRIDVDNDATLPLLAAQATSHARAGADVIAPSGMMDGMVRAIRQGLDGAGFADCRSSRMRPNLPAAITDRFARRPRAPPVSVTDEAIRWIRRQQRRGTPRELPSTWPRGPTW